MATRSGANAVEPIRDLEKIQEIKNYLLARSYRDYFLFVFGINSGLRISDILPLKVLDVRYTKHLKVREKKTKNVRKIIITNALRKEIEKYTKKILPIPIICFDPEKGGNRYIVYRHGKSSMKLQKRVMLKGLLELIHYVKHSVIIFINALKT